MDQVAVFSDHFELFLLVYTCSQSRHILKVTDPNRSFCTIYGVPCTNYNNLAQYVNRTRGDDVSGVGGCQKSIGRTVSRWHSGGQCEGSGVELGRMVSGVEFGRTVSGLGLERTMSGVGRERTMSVMGLGRASGVSLDRLGGRCPGWDTGGR